jgi:hypothetical protein
MLLILILLCGDKNNGCEGKKLTGRGKMSEYCFGVQRRIVVEGRKIVVVDRRRRRMAEEREEAEGCN